MHLHRLRRLAAAAIVTTLGVTGSAATSAPGSGAAPLADRASRAAPGAGWYLTVIDRGPSDADGIRARHQSLELIGPDGARHRVYSHAVHKQGRGSFRLADWSPDGRTALIASGRGLGDPWAKAVDVATGETRRVDLPDSAMSVLLDRDGSGLLVVGFGHRRDGYPTYRVDWSGHRTRLPARVSGTVLPLGETTFLAGAPQSSSHALRVVSTADGRATRRFSTGHVRCEPVRTWDERRVELSCYARHYRQSLRLLDLTTGAVTRLSLKHRRKDGDYGDIDARRIDSGLYLQASGPCGVVFIARQKHSGALERVHVPHAVGNVLLVGGRGSNLVIQHAVDCDGHAPRQALARFNPETRREHLIAMLGRHEGFGQLLAHGDERASAY